MIHTVQFEPTNLCNANCLFCPRDKIKHFGVLKMEVYTDLIDDLKRKFSDELKWIVFAGIGEPFMDHGLLDKVAYAREQFPDKLLSIYSNGSFITEEHIQRLAEIESGSIEENLSLNISLNGGRREVRKALMGLDDWEHVALDVVGWLKHYKINYGLSTVLHPILGKDNAQEAVEVDSHGLSYLIRFQSWGGLLYPYHGPTLDRCNRKEIWKTYDWTGKQIKCCFDIEGQVDCKQCHEGVKI